MRNKEKTKIKELTAEELDNVQGGMKIFVINEKIKKLFIDIANNIKKKNKPENNADE